MRHFSKKAPLKNSRQALVAKLASDSQMKVRPTKLLGQMQNRKPMGKIGTMSALMNKRRPTVTNKLPLTNMMSAVTRRLQGKKF